MATHTHTTPRPAAILGDVLAALVVVRVSEAGISPPRIIKPAVWAGIGTD